MKSTRRLVGGILQIVFGAITVLISLGVMFRTHLDGQRGEAILLFLYSAVIVGTGIYFVATKAKRPSKKVEYSLVTVIIILMILVAANSAYIPAAQFYIGLLLICYAIGAPGKNGYKQLPYATKN